MAIFSDLELERIINEVNDKNSINSVKDRIKNNASEVKDGLDTVAKNVHDNIWLNKHKKKKDGKQKVTFTEDADGNVDCQIGDGEGIDEGFINKNGKKLWDKTKKAKSDLTNDSAIALEKEKQEWQSEPGAKTGETIGNAITGGNFVNTIGKKTGKAIGSKVDEIIARQNAKRKKLKEEVDFRSIYRAPEYTRAMNEFFDITDTETRKVLLAVNEADQNKVLVSLTSKLYDNVVNRIDDIDFGEIELSKGDIKKLPNYETLIQCNQVMRSLLIEFKQDAKPIDTITQAIENIEESTDIWRKAYAVNAELPMITYNTMVLAIINATSYMVSMCVEFIKSPSQDTMQIMIDKSALTKSKNHMIFKNLEAFNSAYNKGQVRKAMMHVIDDCASKKNFVGVGIYGGIGVGAAIIGVAGLLFVIIPVIRELIFLFYYNRVRLADFFEVQADLLQVNAYNVENNRLDLSKEERKKIAEKQMKTAEKFRRASHAIQVDMRSAEQKANTDIKTEENKKYKASDIMEELPDSASSALF